MVEAKACYAVVSLAEDDGDSVVSVVSVESLVVGSVVTVRPNDAATMMAVSFAIAVQLVDKHSKARVEPILAELPVIDDDDVVVDDANCTIWDLVLCYYYYFSISLSPYRHYRCYRYCRRRQPRLDYRSA